MANSSLVAIIIRSASWLRRKLASFQEALDKVGWLFMVAHCLHLSRCASPCPDQASEIIRYFLQRSTLQWVTAFIFCPLLTEECHICIHRWENLTEREDSCAYPANMFSFSLNYWFAIARVNVACTLVFSILWSDLQWSPWKDEMVVKMTRWFICRCLLPTPDTSVPLIRLCFHLEP